MEFILRLQCDDVLGAKIERETPTGLITIATAAPQGESLEVHLLNSPANAGLEFLDGTPGEGLRRSETEAGTAEHHGRHA